MSLLHLECISISTQKDRDLSFLELIPRHIRDQVIELVIVLKESIESTIKSLYFILSNEIVVISIYVVIQLELHQLTDGY